MCFDDRQGRQRTRLAFDFAFGEVFNIFFVHAGSALKQTAVEIEHVAGVGFTAWWTAQQQRDLAVSHGLLGQIVINDQRVLTAVAEVFAHGAARIGADVLHGCRLRSRCGHHDGVFHRAGLL